MCKDFPQNFFHYCYKIECIRMFPNMINTIFWLQTNKHTDIFFWRDGKDVFLVHLRICLFFSDLVVRTAKIAYFILKRRR